jgi:DNA-binding NarL/FixJ family response regulator
MQLMSYIIERLKKHILNIYKKLNINNRVGRPSKVRMEIILHR